MGNLGRRIKAWAGTALTLGTVVFGIAMYRASNDHTKLEVESEIATVDVNEKGGNYNFETAEIIVDGVSKKVALHPGDLIVVLGDLNENGNNNVIITLENGEVLQGKMHGKNLQSYKEITEDMVGNYDTIYRITDKEKFVNFRSSPEINENNILSQILSGEYVVGGSSNVEGWSDVLYVNELGMQEGFISSDLLVEVGNVEKTKGITKKYGVINASEDDKATVTLRSLPRTIQGEVISEIPNGAIVKIIINEQGENPEFEDWEYWLRIEYTSNDGNVNRGYVESKYVKDYQIPISINNAGGVTGIDVSGISPEQLKELLNDGISNVVYDGNGKEYNTSNYSGPINYVMIKLGASAYGQSNTEISLENGNIFENHGWIEKAKICEQMGISYGFYYYSTAINQIEAEEEFRFIKDEISEYKDKNNSEFNLMPFAVDIEVKPNDRQRSILNPDGSLKIVDKADVTDAKAILTNLCYNEFGDVMIYIGGNTCLSDEAIIDFYNFTNRLNPEIDKKVWMAGSDNQDGSTPENTQNYSQQIEGYGYDIIMRQVSIDVNNNGKLVDINSANPEILSKYLTLEKTTHKTPYTNDIVEEQR